MHLIKGLTLYQLSRQQRFYYYEKIWESCRPHSQSALKVNGRFTHICHITNSAWLVVTIAHITNDGISAPTAVQIWEVNGMDDLISRHGTSAWLDNMGHPNLARMVMDEKRFPSAQPGIIYCKDCKHNPKYEWFGCPMSHLNEKQRPETAWCWKAERREVTKWQ